MRDYLLRFDTAADRDAAFPVPEGNPPAWNVGLTSVTHCTVWLRAPHLDTTDEDGRPVLGRIAAPGFWIGLASAEPLDDRHPATIVEMERPAERTFWRDCIRWAATAEFAPVHSVEPIFAGSGYQFD